MLTGYLNENEVKEKILENMPFHTAREIAQQPDMWIKTYSIIRSRSEEIRSFFNNAFRNEKIKVILTGAGSSAYIGDAINPAFASNLNCASVAIPTTDILSHPLYYLPEKKPVLLVSFARSGNSPESIAVYNLVNQLSSPVYHIVITCNESGQLYNAPSKENVLKILLPAETNDKSLAMTSSFSSMMLASLLISKIESIEQEYKYVNRISTSAQYIFDHYTDALHTVSQIPFQRAVFLGSGPLRGTAREAQLKLQELTGGKVICKCDSFLGFRHGPKAVVDDKTLIVYLFSDDDYVRDYEQDLVRQMDNTSRGICQVAVFNKPIEFDIEPELMISLNDSTESLPDEYLCVLHVVVPQILGFFKSIELGLSPDSPSISGAISRVVEGVTIYPFEY